MYRRLLSLFGRTVDIVDRATMVLCVAVLAIVVSLNAAEMFGRTFLARSSPFTVELSLILSSVLYFVGYLVLLKRDGDVVMEYVYNLFPERARRLIDVLVSVAVLFFFALLLRKSIDLYEVTSLMMHPVFPVKQSYTVVPMLAAAAGCLWVALYKALLTIERLVRPAP